MNRTIVLIISFLIVVLPLAGQADSIQYSNDFQMTDGIYLSYGDFRANRPVPKKRIVTTIDTSKIDFFRLLTLKNEIVYLDDSLKEQKIRPERLWGYCQNHSVMIKYHNDFHRLHVIGSLSYFAATVTTYTSVGPTYYGDSYGNPVTTIRQLVFRINEGKLIDLNVDNMEILLEADQPLLNEYLSLKKKKKKREALFRFVRKYNDRHPAFFPVG